MKFDYYSGSEIHRSSEIEEQQIRGFVTGCEDNCRYHI